MKTTKVYPTNPLGIIALFVFLIETIATVTLNTMVKADNYLALYMTIFVIAFPFTVCILFFITLWYKRESLYAPKDFQDDESFVKLCVAKINQIKANSKTSEQENDANNDMIEYVTAISGAQTALERKTTVDVRAAISLLQPVFYKRPYDRMVAIRLARLYRRAEEYDIAISILNKFKSVRDGAPDENAEIDVADAYYNMACYYALKLEKLEKSGYKDKKKLNDLQEEVLVHLKESILRSKINAEHAMQDQDFEFIRSQIYDLVCSLEKEQPNQ